MKKLTVYDRMNAASLRLTAPEWPRVRKARKAASSFETPEVGLPTEVRTLAGREIRLAVAGPEDGPTVVMLSPFPESILSFMGSWEALTEKFRVVAIDLPGFGASEGDRNDMSPKAQGALLAQIIEELGLDEVHLVGPDVGMGAGLAYAIYHDHRLASLMVGHGPGAPGPFKLALVISLLARFGPMRASTALLGTGPMIAFTGTMGAIRHRSNAVQIDDYKRAYAGRGREVVYWFEDLRAKGAELAERLDDVDVPTLVFWGDLDVMFDPSNAVNLHEGLPNSELLILPEAGHLSWSDQPEKFAAAITEWVEGGYKAAR